MLWHTAELGPGGDDWPQVNFRQLTAASVSWQKLRRVGAQLFLPPPNRAELSGRSWDPTLSDMFPSSGQLSTQLWEGGRVGGLEGVPGHQWAQLFEEATQALRQRLKVLEWPFQLQATGDWTSQAPHFLSTSREWGADTTENVNA